MDVSEDGSIAPYFQTNRWAKTCKNEPSQPQPCRLVLRKGDTCSDVEKRSDMGKWKGRTCSVSSCNRQVMQKFGQNLVLLFK
mmetsp:Transcript_47408/g.103387  ORF Transcript_47408/g.103387 Transcript_47408/m.103387 type:complete len:82 (-) Transcript_47408:659-904(-)